MLTTRLKINNKCWGGSTGPSYEHILKSIGSLVPNRQFLQSLLGEVLTAGKDKKSELHSFYKFCINSIRPRDLEVFQSRLCRCFCRTVLGWWTNMRHFVKFLQALLVLESETCSVSAKFGRERLGEVN